LTSLIARPSGKSAERERRHVTPCGKMDVSALERTKGFMGRVGTAPIVYGYNWRDRMNDAVLVVRQRAASSNNRGTPVWTYATICASYAVIGF
jgi:hypothetical protein